MECSFLAESGREKFPSTHRGGTDESSGQNTLSAES